LGTVGEPVAVRDFGDLHPGSAKVSVLHGP
jgi:hypothetical protein